MINTVGVIIESKYLQLEKVTVSGTHQQRKKNLSQHRDNNHSLQTQWSEQSGQQEWKQHEQKKDPGPDVEIEHTAEWICIFTELLPVKGEILLFSTLNPII